MQDEHSKETDKREERWGTKGEREEEGTLGYKYIISKKKKNKQREGKQRKRFKIKNEYMH